MTTVAFLGTGTMGAPMARNLLAAGFDVRAWNRTRSKAEPLAESGATIADTPEEAARGADFLITMMLDADATVTAARAAVAELPEAAPWVQMGTLGLSGIGQVAEVAGARPLVDAPVLGTRAPAEQGTLIVLGAAAAHLREEVQPLFDAMGHRTTWISEDPSRGDATRLKLAINNWVLALTNAVGESIALAETLGVDPNHFLEALDGTPTDSPYAHIKGKAILNEEYTPLFSTRGAHKDAELISEAAGQQLRLDVAEAVREKFRRAVDAGHGEQDMASAYYACFPDPG